MLGKSDGTWFWRARKSKQWTVRFYTSRIGNSVEVRSMWQRRNVTKGGRGWRRRDRRVFARASRVSGVLCTIVAIFVRSGVHRKVSVHVKDIGWHRGVDSVGFSRWYRGRAEKIGEKSASTNEQYTAARHFSYTPSGVLRHMGCVHWSIQPGDVMNRALIGLYLGPQTRESWPSKHGCWCAVVSTCKMFLPRARSIRL